MNLDEARFGSLLVEDAPPLINIGTGEDVTIRELAETVARVLGFHGTLVFDTTKPDGTPRKLMDVTRLHIARLAPHHQPGAGNPPHLEARSADTSLILALPSTPQKLYIIG